MKEDGVNNEMASVRGRERVKKKRGPTCQASEGTEQHAPGEAHVDQGYFRQSKLFSYSSSAFTILAAYTAA